MAIVKDERIVSFWLIRIGVAWGGQRYAQIVKFRNMGTNVSKQLGTQERAQFSDSDCKALPKSQTKWKLTVVATKKVVVKNTTSLQVKL